MKILIFILIVIFQATLAVGGFVMLLLGLNGYSGTQAQPGLIFYIVLNLAAALGLGAAGVFLKQKLVERFWLGNFSASLAAIGAAIALGSLIVIVGIFASAILVEALRNK